VDVSFVLSLRQSKEQIFASFCARKEEKPFKEALKLLA
jgi:hypothetical protein